MSLKKFTLAQLADAIEKNGFRQIQYTFFETEDGPTQYEDNVKNRSLVTGACALGQAYINLGVRTDVKELTSSSYKRGSYRILTEVVRLNDHEGKTCAQIAAHLRGIYPDDIFFVGEEYDYGQ